MENYRILVTKDSADDKVIKRDIHRTFPANDFFKVSRKLESKQVLERDEIRTLSHFDFGTTTFGWQKGTNKQNELHLS